MQLDLDLTRRTHGGKREGAGRKKSGTRRDPAHRTRPPHVGRYPVHVVMRVRREVGRLRRGLIYTVVRTALAKIAAKLEFRIVHISVQHNHIHLIVEAADQAALESGMRSLAISLAHRINDALDRAGKVFEFRYHTTTLRSPRQTRHAISYVLNNWRRHNEDERGLREREALLDPYSSAISFTGWHDFRLGAWPLDYIALPVSPPQTWLLEKGWKLANKPIRVRDVPGPLS